MARFTSKPVAVEAVQFTAETTQELAVFLEGTNPLYCDPYDKGATIIISTHAGSSRVHADDWVVKVPNGEIYVLSSQVFESTYEPAG